MYNACSARIDVSQSTLNGMFHDIQDRPTTFRSLYVYALSKLCIMHRAYIIVCIDS